MVRIKFLDIGADILDPSNHTLVVTIGRARKVADTVSTTSGLVGQLPCHDGWGVLVSIDEYLEVFLVGVNNLRDVVEVVVVFSTKVDSVDVHPTIICPLYKAYSSAQLTKRSHR